MPNQITPTTIQNALTNIDPTKKQIKIAKHIVGNRSKLLTYHVEHQRFDLYKNANIYDIFSRVDSAVSAYNSLNLNFKK